jgi:hypothetical protein
MVKLALVAWGAGAVAVGVLAARHITRRVRDTSDPAAERLAVGWGLAEDISQAVSNVAPHENGALNMPRRLTEE